MKIIYPGHTYKAAHLDGDGTTHIQFVQRPPFHTMQEGTTSQELLRVMIDRVKVLEEEIASPLNEQILFHLRQALCLFEARALLRKAEKKEIYPELLPVGSDGHFMLKMS